ncbi:hypothetical protein NQ315_008872 [Exocentrus adspersus]|uniref:Reverse transcriptase domain-containing protein n=1 Tax=Exocentrus adspersus TaxID=1586481 RepID=A0AAV8V8I6_9CUCU|nr:hypothetical protein NQ315_008872 [Exocentrus adspersus]
MPALDISNSNTDDPGPINPVVGIIYPPPEVRSILLDNVNIVDSKHKVDFGMAMGSSLSPIMSNIFMEHFEETYVKSYINKPKIWWRYVDDVFSIWPHGQDNLTDFLNFLNNIEPTIKFTLEL